MTSVTLATEDELSEAVGLRLLSDAGIAVGQFLRRGGFGYLRKRLPNFCEMAARLPVILLTDLDETPCPSQLIQDWFGERARPGGLIFRVAVPEVEAWLLADHSGMHTLFKAKKSLKLPPRPEAVGDAKRELLRIAERHAPKDVRLDLIVKAGAAASQGLNYNTRLCPWVREVWDPAEARGRSPSLDRAMRRFEELASTIRLARS